MPYLNKMSVMGNLGKTPELRYFADGTPTTTISIAYSENWKDSKSGEARESTEWFTAILYRKQAELVCQYMQKGDCIQVHGKLRSRTYQKDTETIRVFEIIVDQMEMIRTNKQTEAKEEAQ
ncbi:single-stranded DNA-binding protein [Neisseria sp. Ec49-e6-T10]|uniref:single-stranded DNA-binding protein n=1 Tax=Neisseria sp. Ec49-e6-T10 TaxID=3140744 RepID=UPI003EC03B41